MALICEQYETILNNLVNLGVPTAYKFTGQTAIAYPANLAVFTAPSDGLYRVSGSAYPTTLSSSSWVINTTLVVTQKDGAVLQAVDLDEINIQTGGRPTDSVIEINSSYLVRLAAGATLQLSTSSISGSNSGGAFNLDYTVERLA